MKAERRHELQKNSLVQVLSDLPLYLRFYANYILIGVIIICAIVLLVRHRRNSAMQAAALAQESLLAARSQVSQFSRVDATQATEVAKAQERNKLASEIAVNIQQTLDNTSDPGDAPLRAMAHLVLGDMNWELANLPDLPGSATQPGVTAPLPASKYLDNAHDAYLTVVDKYPDQTVTRAVALMGLAAIEENRGNWDKATAFYKKVIDDQAITAMFKAVANQRLSLIPELQNPIYLGSFSSTKPTTEPSTYPATAESTTLPVILESIAEPVTVPAAPATVPATVPILD